MATAGTKSSDKLDGTGGSRNLPDRRLLIVDGRLDVGHDLG